MRFLHKNTNASIYVLSISKLEYTSSWIKEGIFKGGTQLRLSILSRYSSKFQLYFLAAQINPVLIGCFTSVNNKAILGILQGRFSTLTISGLYECVGFRWNFAGRVREGRQYLCEDIEATSKTGGALGWKRWSIVWGVRREGKMRARKMTKSDVLFVFWMVERFRFHLERAKKQILGR